MDWPTAVTLSVVSLSVAALLIGIAWSGRH